MSEFIAILNKWKVHWKCSLIPLMVGCSCGMLLYLNVFQRLFLSKTYLIISLAAAIIAAVLVIWILNGYLIKVWLDLPKSMRWGVLVLTLALTLMFLFNANTQPLRNLFPIEDVQISIPRQEADEGAEDVRLLGVNTRYGFIHYTKMNVEGDWQRDGSNIVFNSSRDAVIKIKERIGPWLEVTFRQTSYSQPVQVTIAGKTTVFDLRDAKGGELAIRHAYEPPFIAQVPFIFSFIGVVWFLASTLLIFLGAWRTSPHHQQGQPAWTWVLYMLPMLIAWGFTLLVFWPGMLSNDAMAQWVQGVTGEYNDLQSAFHSLLLSGFIKVWNSPGLAVIAQILAFASVVAWGLKQFESYGVPPAALWLISMLFAVSPVYNLAVVTLWKDVAYAIAFLWMAVLYMLVVLSQGKWIAKGSRWIILGLAGFLVAIFRLNGLVVALLPMTLLPVLYKPHWKRLLGSLLLACALFGIVKGPLYSSLKVEKGAKGQSNLLLLHHIAAHVDAGTPMTGEESAYLNKFMPLEDWDYWCCYVAPISYNDNFDRASFLSSGPQNRKLALDLFLRDPCVNIAHSFCAGNLVWKFTESDCHVKSSHAFNRWGQPGTEDWIIPNDLNIHEAPVIKGIVIPYVYWLRSLGFADDQPAWFLRPAVYLFLAVFCLGVAFIRLRDWKVWLAGLPIYVHTLVIYLISFAPAYRYHYNILFAGLFCLVFLFIQPSPEQAE